MSERRWHGAVRLLQPCVPLVAVVAALAPLDPVAVERWFSSGVYPQVQRVLTPISNLLPVAWLDLLSLAAVAWLIWTWRRAARRTAEPARRRLVRAAAATILTAAAAYLAFLSLWGLNYRRVPLAGRLIVEERPASTAEVVALGKDAAQRLNELYGPGHLAGWREPVWRNAALREAFDRVQRQLGDAPPARPGRLKQSLFGMFFRWSSVDGMINPFGLEVIANPDLLPFERPFVAAHEWAHLAGYADEAEANFVGWLTCLSADPASQYSGWLFLYWQVAGELPFAERVALGDLLAEGPRGDLTAIAARLRRGDVPMLRRASWMLYDRYLKANRVEAGVRSYGAVVSLILRARFEDGWRPVRRVPVYPP